MNSSKKIWLSLFLASAMALSPSFYAFAEDGVGPAFDPRYNSDIEGTSEAAEADSTNTAPETETETDTEAGDTTQAGTDA